MITYPTPYAASYKMIYMFHQTGTSTTLAADVTDSDTSIPLTNSTGFSVPGVLYFPSNGEIMRMTGVNGNTVTVERDGRYGGTPITSHSAGETVVFAHLTRYGGSTGSVKVFADDARPGDWVAFGTYYVMHVLESIDLTVLTPAVYDSASFKVYEAKFFTSSSIKAYSKWTDVNFYDGTLGFRRSGVIGLEVFEDIYGYTYLNPGLMYNYMYDENKNSYINFWVKVELSEATNWTQGVTIDVSGLELNEKVLRPTDAGTISFEDVFQADLTSPLQLTVNDTIIRGPTVYTGSQNLFVDVTSFSSAGSVTIEGFEASGVTTYMTFDNGMPSMTLRDFARGMDYFFSDVHYNNYVYVGSDFWVGEGRFAGGKAVYFNSTRQSNDPLFHKYFFEGYENTYSFSVEVWFKSSSDGVIMMRGKNYYTSDTGLWSFRVESGSLLFRLQGVSQAFEASVPFTNDGAWHQAVSVFDGGSLKLYLDGVLQDTVTVTEGLAAQDEYTAFCLGDRLSTGSGFWDGAIDEIIIYPYALTDAEVSDHNTSGSGARVLGKTVTVDVNGVGKYPAGSFTFLTSVSNTGSYDYAVYQNRLGVFNKEKGKYVSFVDFSLQRTNLEDSSNSVFQVGLPTPLGARCFNMHDITTGYHFRMGYTFTDDKGKQAYSKGGVLVLYNTMAKGSYRNYFNGVELYGTLVKFYSASIETQANTKLVGTVFEHVADSKIAFALYNSMVLGRDTVDHLRTNNAQVYWYEKVPLYKKDTQEMNPPTDFEFIVDGSWCVYTDYHVNRQTVIYGGSARNNVGDAIYSSNAGTTVIIDCDYSSLNVYPRSYRAVTEGYTLRLRVLDEKGNPVQGARVKILDKNGNPAVFLPKLSSTGTFTYFTQTYTYGDNYGTPDTSLAVNDASVFSPGEVIRADAERMLVTSADTANNIINVERGYEGTPCVNHYYMSNQGAFTIEERKEYLETDADGYVPRIVLYVKDYASTTDYVERGPFKLIVGKAGKKVQTTFSISERSDWDAVLKDDELVLLTDGSPLVKVDEGVYAKV